MGFTALKTGIATLNCPYDNKYNYVLTFVFYVVEFVLQFLNQNHEINHMYEGGADPYNYPYNLAFLSFLAFLLRSFSFSS